MTNSATPKSTADADAATLAALPPTAAAAVNLSTPVALPVQTDAQRIQKALALAVAYGGVDGAHHKDWVIDQMVRALTGSPVAVKNAKDCHGKGYTYLEQGASPEYTALVANACDGEDGPQTYSWETGVAP